MEGKQFLSIVIWYQDKKASIIYEAGEPLIIGRKQLQTLFDINGASFQNISRHHLEIYYDERRDEFWARDNSLLGTLVRIVGQNEALGPEFLYHHDQFMIRRRMRLRLHNENSQREPDDVIIEIDNQTHDETRPILPSSTYWDRLLKQLHSVRAAHIFGIAGIGKSMLAKRLLAPSGTGWQRQRDRQLGGHALVAWIDCRFMEGDTEPLWQHLARKMLFALQIAADDQRLFDIHTELESHLRYFDETPTKRIGQLNPIFRQALRTVLKQGFRPIFIFDDFDAIYPRLDPFMLYQLYQIHQWPEIGDAVRYLILTRHPLDVLRSDDKDDGVSEFSGLFARHTIQMGGSHGEDFRDLWGQIAPSYRNLPEDLLQNTLYELSGGHPGLLRELYQEIVLNDWLDRPLQWKENLDALNWEDRPLQMCEAVWEGLNSAEKKLLAAYLQYPNDISLQQSNTLKEMGLLKPNGDLFSPFFRATVQRAATQLSQLVEGLIINTEQRRVYLDGNDLTAQLQGRKLDVLIYLYHHPNRLCNYEELIKHTLPKETVFSDIYWESERGALQRTVSRLCRIVDPGRKLIFNEFGQGYIFRMG